MPRINKTLMVDDFDLANLRESGITDETIRVEGLRTTDGRLVFEYRDLSGKPTGFERYRPHVPRLDANGKPIKYEQAAGSNTNAYIPAASRQGLADTSVDVLFVEGEKKALAAAQAGYIVIGLGGVWCWKARKGSDDLLPDLAKLASEGRIFYICFDFDTKSETRAKVDSAKRRFAARLRKAGAADVLDVVLPPGPNGQKQGVDDFLVEQGEDAFKQLVSAAKPVPSLAVPRLMVNEGRTDAANAARLIDKFGRQVQWIGPWDKWVIWTGRHWKTDSELRIQALAKEVAADLWDQVKEDCKKVKPDIAGQMINFARYSNNAAGVKAMVDLARSEPGVAVPVEELDSDPWLLNVENGTIDLRSGQLREHNRLDFITKLAPVTFNPEAKCPEWEQFLAVIFAQNGELIEYLRRLVGYSATGVTEEHILPFLYGTGANGKSTFCELLFSQLGPDYSMKAPPDLLMAKRGESHPTERADLHGKRLVGCIETEAGRRMAESLVKELTGGDRIRARRMREDFWEFIPTHHVWLVSNHKPVVTGTDHGIWRRIKLIPFDVVIPADKQDKKLGAKLQAELSGILNWVIAGCLDWQSGGMREPAIVQAATTEYSDEMDDVGQFLSVSCELREDLSTPATKLFQAFVEETGSRMSQKAFGSELRRRGFVSARITSGINKSKHCWRGIWVNDGSPHPDQLAKNTAQFNAQRELANKEKRNA